MSSRGLWIPSYNGNQVASWYDSQGRLASVTLPDLDGNPATTNDIATYGYQYDARGNMVQLTDPLGRDTRFTFNNQGQQLTRTLPLGFGADGMFGTADDPAVGQASSLPFTETSQYDTKGRKILETRVVKKLGRGRSSTKHCVRRTIGFEMSARRDGIDGRKWVPIVGFQAVFANRRMATLTHS